MSCRSKKLVELGVQRYAEVENTNKFLTENAPDNKKSTYYYNDQENQPPKEQHTRTLPIEVEPDKIIQEALIVFEDDGFEFDGKTALNQEKQPLKELHNNIPSPTLATDGGIAEIIQETVVELEDDEFQSDDKAAQNHSKLREEANQLILSSPLFDDVSIQVFQLPADTEILTQKSDTEEEQEAKEEEDSSDPDFEIDEFADNSEDNENEVIATELTEVASDEPATENIGRKRKRLCKRTLNKKKRMLGQTYLGFSKPAGQSKTFHNVPRNERKLKDRCKCVRKTTKKACSGVTEKDREEIFRKFWTTTNWDQRKQFVCSTVKKVDVKRPKYRRDDDVPRRTATLQYNLIIREREVPVCKTMYLNTLCLGEWSVRNWVDRSNYGMNESGEYSATKRQKKPDNFAEDKTLMNTFLEQLNKLPSHYCRKNTSKLYLEQSFQSYEQLYKEYVKYCHEKSKKPLSKSILMQLVNSKNISIFHPRKDQCNDCFKFKSGNLSQEEYDKHISLKNKAREEKELDKESAKRGTCIAVTMDVQAVKLCPNIPANALYYKTKLNCHNFTIYDIATRQCTCYWFDELTADGQASVFASCLINFLEENYLSDGMTKKPIIIYSDGCTAQNRNCVLSNALLYLSEKHSICITQKFLIKGHTQMECDSVHSTIEKALKDKEIYVPYDYVTVTRQARKGNPYIAKKPTSDFFLNYGYKPLLKYNSIRPGKMARDPAVTDLRVLQYVGGKIFYKLHFDDELKELPQRSKNINWSTADFPKLFSGPLLITDRKFKDLQEIKSVIPKDYWAFYEGIPH